MAKFQQKYATEKEDLNSPEHELWTSVLSKAAHDALYGSDWFESRKALEWFKSQRADFKKVCELAGKDPNYVYTHIIKKIKDREAHMEWVKNGQRYYVKDNNVLPRGGKVFHSHYRGQHKARVIKDPSKKRGRPKKKHLTGNAYYAAKAAKEMKKKSLYYQGMGAKGGRPRIYNVV
tara:strand:+ start:1071 stop:1598 length:528 start_codon:yes stop_codon:yes gene_type:complete